VQPYQHAIDAADDHDMGNCHGRYVYLSDHSVVK